MSFTRTATFFLAAINAHALLLEEHNSLSPPAAELILAETAENAGLSHYPVDNFNDLVMQTMLGAVLDLDDDRSGKIMHQYEECKAMERKDYVSNQFVDCVGRLRIAILAPISEALKKDIMNGEWDCPNYSCS